MSALSSDILPVVTQGETERWNREWTHYFTLEGSAHFLRDGRDFRVIDEVAGMAAAQVFDAHLIAHKDGTREAALQIWIEGDKLVDKAVVEIGCGPGWLGKRLGHVCKAYIGIDYSELALAIARGVSPPTCEYVHLGDRERIIAAAGQYDAMVSRHFFIHQNFANARWVLGLGAYLLRPGGEISADFYLADPAVEQGVTHPARSALDPKHPSCAFLFSDGDIAELAALHGLDIVGRDDRLDQQRRFVRFRKRAA